MSAQLRDLGVSSVQVNRAAGTFRAAAAATSRPYRDALLEKERREWQPKVAQTGGVHSRVPQAEAPEIGA